MNSDFIKLLANIASLKKIRKLASYELQLLAIFWFRYTQWYQCFYSFWCRYIYLFPVLVSLYTRVPDLVSVHIKWSLYFLTCSGHHADAGSTWRPGVRHRQTTRTRAPTLVFRGPSDCRLQHIRYFGGNGMAHGGHHLVFHCISSFTVSSA